MLIVKSYVQCTRSCRLSSLIKEVGFRAPKSPLYTADDIQFQIQNYIALLFETSNCLTRLKSNEGVFKCFSNLFC